MSSKSLSPSRKRLRTHDFRDSDEDSIVDNEGPPIKQRKGNESRLQLRVREKIQDWAVWLNTLQLKGLFAKAFKAGALFQNVELMDDEEEDVQEEEVIFQKVVKPDPEKLTPLIKKLGQKHYSRRHLERNGSYPIVTYYDRSLNGSSLKDWNCSMNGDYKSSKKRTVNYSGVVSNPKNEIEIYLGTKPKVLVPEADEVEIVCESPSTKQKHISLKKSSVPSAKKSVFHDSHTWDSSSKRSQVSSRRGFTANEVVRLQEKEQYKLLLQKFMNSESYYSHHPSIKKTQEKDVSTQSNVKLSCTGNHFKKEVIQRPIDKLTIEKYFKPCQLLKLDQVKKETPIETVKIHDDEEDVQIIKIELPKWKTPKLKAQTLFSPEWLLELKQCVDARSSERLKIVEAHERRLEELKKQRLRKQLDSGITTSQVVDTEFPELTPEMEEAVTGALSKGPPGEQLGQIKCLLRKDFETLGGLNWLNDLVINEYFDLIVKRSKQEGYPSIHAFNTYFYSNVKTKGYSCVRRWTRKIDIFSFDLNFVPIHLGVHWCLAVIDHRSKTISYYDSMGSGEELCLDILHNYLQSEYKDKKGASLDPCIYTTEIMKDIPQQMNGSDCGMFTLKYAEYISRDAEITFNQSHMQYFRRRMVYELLKCQLL